MCDVRVPFVSLFLAVPVFLSGCVLHPSSVSAGCCSFDAMHCSVNASSWCQADRANCEGDVGDHHCGGTWIVVVSTTPQPGCCSFDGWTCMDDSFCNQNSEHCEGAQEGRCHGRWIPQQAPTTTEDPADPGCCSWDHKHCAEVSSDFCEERHWCEESKADGGCGGFWIHPHDISTTTDPIIPGCCSFDPDGVSCGDLKPGDEYCMHKHKCEDLCGGRWLEPGAEHQLSVIEDGEEHVYFISNGGGGLRRNWGIGLDVLYQAKHAYIMTVPDKQGSPNKEDYKYFYLAGKTLSFTIDLSLANTCGDVATVYLLPLPGSHSGPEGDWYCDAAPHNGFDDCAEIDLLEGNAFTFRTTTHECHPWGSTCDDSDPGGSGHFNNIGNGNNEYGPGKKIDSRSPFNASFDFDASHGVLRTRLMQDGRETAVENRQMGTLWQNVDTGFALLFGFWGTGNHYWLDGGSGTPCSGGEPQPVSSHPYTVSNIRVESMVAFGATSV